MRSCGRIASTFFAVALFDLRYGRLKSRLATAMLAYVSEVRTSPRLNYLLVNIIP